MSLDEKESLESKDRKASKARLGHKAMLDLREFAQPLNFKTSNLVTATPKPSSDTLKLQA